MDRHSHKRLKRTASKQNLKTRKVIREENQLMFSTLPNDILASIMGFLPLQEIHKHAATARCFRNNVVNARRYVQVVVFNEKMSKSSCGHVIEMLLKPESGLGRDVREIRVDGFARCPLDDGDLSRLVKKASPLCKNLEKLLIQGSMQKLNKEEMVILLKHCTSIKNVRHPESMSIFKSLLEEKERENKPCELKNMELVNITIKDQSEIDNIHILAKLFPGLRSLTLRDDTYDEDGDDNMDQMELRLAQGIGSLLPKMQNLEHICFPGVGFNLIVRDMVEKRPKIKKLSLPGSNLSDEDIRALTEIFPNVEDASFPGNSIGDTAVQIMNKAWGANLKTLSLDGTQITKQTVSWIRDGYFACLENIYLPNDLQTEETEDTVRKGVHTFWCVTW